MLITSRALRPLRPLRPLGLTLALLLLAPLVHGAENYKQEKKRYETYMERPSLWMRHRGRKRFAKTGDVRALKILSKSYNRAEVPKDQNQYLLASLCADSFRAPVHTKLFRDWRKRNGRAKDAWLWYRSLAVELKNEGPEALLAIARSHRDTFLRMAAIGALVEAKDAAVLPLLKESLVEPPAQAFDRALLLETTADALYRLRKNAASDEFKATVRALIPFFEEKGVEDRTRLVMARRLARVFRTQTLYRSTAAWQALLAGKKPPPPSKAVTRAARARFLGIEASGHRIAYVIDLSDSMLTPLTTEEIRDLRKPKSPAVPTDPKKRDPVVTGKRAPQEPEGPAPGNAPSPGRAEGKRPPEARLPWDRIRTRFDAAREFLKLSLAMLMPEQRFCVIFFGSEAGLMNTTPGMRRATTENIEKVIRELESIEIGPTRKDRPHGTLRGYTNMHGGLHRAFKVKSRGLSKQHEYVDPDTFEEGCDTIFLLSDGKPTWDDWPEWDLLEADDESGDPELAGKVKQQKKGHFYGPYAVTSTLIDDVRRLNLFRHVEVHCVGLGEYDPRLLTWLAHNGLGVFRPIGVDK